MKRTLHKMIALLAILFVPFLLSSQEYASIFDESFENGIPEGWTQECVSGNVHWVKETGGTYPNGAFDGNARLRFSADTNITTNSVTRLITPDLCKVEEGKVSFARLADPILVFAHAQDRWTNDFDVLRVLYRTKADGPWAKLYEYDKYISKWSQDTLSLAFLGGVEYFQIAFEAVDNLGRGVVLDKVELRSAPNCFAPDEMTIGDQTSDSVRISWVGSWDVKGFALKVSTTALTPEQLEDASLKADICDVFLQQVNTYVVKGLQPNVKYYYYMRSDCYGEYSEWAVDSFTTVNYMDFTYDKPYEVDFEMEATHAHPSWMTTWNYGAAEDAYKPFINTNRTSSLASYSTTGDYALCFYGDNYYSGTSNIPYIPENSYAYAVMPKLRDTVNVEDLYLSLWTYNYNAEKFDIIVGLVEDPTDMNTFEPVDTIYTKYIQNKEHRFVSFENYKGTGRYIAFMSNFSYRNCFVFDNLTVGYRPTFMKVNEFSMLLPTATSVKFDFDAPYATYDVVISKTELAKNQIDSVANVSGKKIANHAIIDGLETSTEYCVYVRGCDDKNAGEWSDVKYIRTLDKVTALPYALADGYDAASSPSNTKYAYQVRHGNKSLGSYLPKGTISFFNYLYATSSSPVQTSNSYSETAPSKFVYQLRVGNQTYAGAYAALVFPELQLDFDTTRISFYIANPEDSYKLAEAVVGFMSVANDITTFEAIDTIPLNEGVGRYVFYDLDKYTNIKGKFFAVLSLGDAVVGKSAYNSFYVDDVKYTAIPECASPTNIKIVATPEDPSEVKFSWDANGADAWVFRLFATKHTTDEMEGDAANQIAYLYNDTLYANSITVKNLEYPNVKYYYSIRSICGTKGGEWTFVDEYMTECKGYEKLPYTEDFERYVASTEGSVKDFPECMYTQQFAYLDPNRDIYYYFPYIEQPTSAKDGNQTKMLYLINNTSRSGYQDRYVALPKMEKPVKELQVTFDLYSGQTNYSILVGAMTDPNDSTTFEVIKSIPMNGELANKWCNQIVLLDEYKGAGEYIAFKISTKVTTWAAYYLDNIVVEEIQTCARPENVKIEDISFDYAKLSWQSPAVNNKWAVLLAKQKLTNDQLAESKIDDDLVFRVDTVTSNPCTIQNLESNTGYYVYVRAICDDEVGVWSRVITLRTNCQPQTPNDLKVEDFEFFAEGVAPDCYLVGNNTSMTNSAYIPYCTREYANKGGLVSLKIRTEVSASAVFNGAYVVSPRLDIDDIKDVRLKFWGAAPSKTYASDKYAHSIIVGVVTNPSNLATFEAIDTLNFGLEWRPYEVTFEKYDGDYLGNYGKYIIFVSEFSKSNIVYIDDISYGFVPECHTGVKATNVADKSFDLNLTGNAPFQVVCSNKFLLEDELANKTAIDVTANTTTLNNLKPNTDYYVYVRSTCKDNNWSEWSTVKMVRTSCSNKITLPFIEGFESVYATSTTEVGLMPQCWNGLYTAGNTDYPSVVTYANTGSSSVCLDAKAADAYTYLVTEEIDVDSLNTCMVTLFARSYTNSSAYNKEPYLIVGVVENIEDIQGSFVPVDTVQVSGSFVKRELYFTNYAGSGKHVAFMTDFALNVKQARVYLDDIIIEKIPDCPRPYNFRFVNHSDTSLTFSFSHDGGVKFEFKCGEVGFDPIYDDGIVTEFTSRTGEAKGLAPATTYDVYVRAFCNDTAVSPWSYVDTRTTLKGFVKEMPYICDFEDSEENALWEFVQEGQTDKWYIGVDGAFEVSETKEATDDALYISYDGGISMKYFNFLGKEGKEEGKDKEEGKEKESLMPQSYSWAYRTINFDKGVYNISYSWTCTGFGGGKEPEDYIKAVLIPSTSTFKPGDFNVYGVSGQYELNFMGVPSYCIELSAGEKMTMLSGNDGWSTYTAEVVIEEDIAGIYNLVFFWHNQEGREGETFIRSGAIDDIRIERQNCTAPLNFVMKGFDNKSVDLAWETMETKAEYIVKVTDQLEGEIGTLTDFVFVDTVQTTSVKATGLSGMTSYRAYVATLCSEGVGKWVGPIEFKTPCDPIATDVVYTYDEEEDFSNCYVVSHQQPTQDIYKYPRPKLVQNDKEVYDRTGGATSKAIKFTQKGTVDPNKVNDKFNPAWYDPYAGGYLALPLFEGDMDSLYLTFWMRCVTHNANTGLVSIENIDPEATNGYSYKGCARKITVGAMTDPNDPKTFKSLKVFEYPYTTKEITSSTKITDDLTGCNFWVKCSVPLKDAQGAFIAFKNERYGVFHNTVYIDDIEVTSKTCTAPINVKVDNVRIDEATLNVVDYANEYIVEIAEDADFTNAIKDTVARFPYKFENLKEFTNYYVRVKSVCGPFEMSEWSLTSVFKTLRGVCYRDGFEQLGICSEDWSRATSPAIADVITYGSGSFTYTQPNNVTGWSTKVALAETGLFSTNNMTATFGGSYNYTTKTYSNTYWLFSPAIDLADANAKYHMSFELALTDYQNADEVSVQSIDDVKNKFAIVISEDAGKTWKRDNTTMWNWNTGENTCLDIPHTGKQYSMDLTKYAGKAIMVAFYIEADGAIGRADIHLDNVHINAYAEDGEVATICETSDYENEYFSLVAEDLEVGKNDFIKWNLAEKDVLDTCYALSVNVTPMEITELAPAYMCENGEYSDNANYFVGLSQAGIYKRKLKAHNGCDSIVILNLNTYPIVETQVFDTICQGMSLNWNGTEYRTTGVYKDTLQSVVTGCDSIVTLVLKVNDAIRVTEYVDICYGETYDFLGETISKSGSYEKLVQTPGGCDSLITLVANVLPDYSNIVINAVIAKGETYNGNGFVGLTQPGSYRLPLKSKVGDCDSIVTLNLVVGDATDYQEVNICFGDTYVFGSQTITQSGQYIETFTEDSVVLLNATVLPDLRQTIDTIICKGEVYNENGFENLSTTGTYTKEYTSVDGCDSTITLNLVVINGETIYVSDTITTNDLPYEYMGLYYDIATPAGTYTETIEVVAENCKDVIVHTLVVEMADAVENVEAMDLVLVPNPVKVNNTLYVEAEFTVNERKGMLVEVFNAVGQLVIEDTPEVYPVAIKGLSERGVYIVRIITGEGNVYQGKVIVQ